MDYRDAISCGAKEAYDKNFLMTWEHSSPHASHKSLLRFQYSYWALRSLALSKELPAFVC